MSKKKGSNETSSFVSEFVAMKVCTEYIRGLKFKLQMMEIQCNRLAFVYGGNQSILSNTITPHSILKKTSNCIAYHFVREGPDCNEWRDTYINTNDNRSDLLTKPFPHGEKRMKFCKMLMYHM